MRQALAIFLDSYRELNARKLFWVTLVISLAVMAGYGSIGFDKTGMSLFFGLTHVESEFINSETPWARALYMGIFSDFIVTLWLGWVATILALISTTSVFPDLIAGGSIDLILSRPISRLKLFLLKYLASLLFVVLQVTVFCLGAFVAVGARIGEWNPKIFAAVPLVTLLFSYLFSVNVLVAIITRSALAALLLTLLCWFSLFGVQTADETLNQFRILAQVQVEKADKEIARAQARVDRGGAQSPDVPAAQRDRLENAEETKRQATRTDQTLARWHKPIRAVKLVLPKTQDTVGLLSRWLKDPRGFSIMAMMRGEMNNPGAAAHASSEHNEMMRRMEVELDERSPWLIIGTSLGFEAVVLGIAAFVFLRRDF